MESFTLQVEPRLGARWTSLRDPYGREWLWSRPDPARELVVAGQPFVDVGGMEECFPTISGTPDHGAVWSVPWREAGGSLTVEGDGFVLERSTTVAAEVTVSYRLTARPGFTFIWAMHALLVPDVGTELRAPAGHPVRSWTDEEEPVDGFWPEPLRRPWSRLGPDDGTATFAVLPGLEAISVREPAGATLRFRLHAPGQPSGFGVWRNLGGFPAQGPVRYRSLGVEPMIGRVPDLSKAGPGEAGVVADEGRASWQVVLDAGAAAAEIS